MVNKAVESFVFSRTSVLRCGFKIHEKVHVRVWKMQYPCSSPLTAVWVFMPFWKYYEGRSPCACLCAY